MAIFKEKNGKLVFFSGSEIWKLGILLRSLSVTSVGINNHRELDFWAEIFGFLKNLKKKLTKIEIFLNGPFGA